MAKFNVITVLDYENDKVLIRTVPDEYLYEPESFVREILKLKDFEFMLSRQFNLSVEL